MDPFLTPSAIYFVAGLALSSSSIGSKRQNSNIAPKPVTTYVGSEVLVSTSKLPKLKSGTQAAISMEHSTSIVNIKDKLFDQIFSYMPTDLEVHDHDEPTYEHLMVAYEFIKKLPESIKVPKFMKNDFGGIGFYWEMGNFYLDVDIEDDSTLSFFAHDRIQKKDLCIEPISVCHINDEWFSENFSYLIDRSYQLAA